MMITAAHRAARNQASIDLADAGAGPSSIKFYTAQGGTLLAQRTLAKPCGAINGEGRIQLQASAADDLVGTSGAAGWAEWCDGDGHAIGGGAVTDEAGEGPFKLEGTVGTMIYAGGVVALKTDALLG